MTNLESWLVTISSGIAIAVFLLAGMKFLIDHRVKSLREDTAQLRNNGGSSVKDSVDRNETMTREVLRKVDKLNDRLTEHLIQAAGKDAEQDVQLRILLGRRSA